MRKIFISTVTVLAGMSWIFFFITAFNSAKCEHVFTQVEQASIKIERPAALGGQGYYPYTWPSGVQEGKELVCVKCFLIQKQVLDYGQIEHGQTLTGLMPGTDTSLFIQGGRLIFDTVNVIRK